MRTFKYSSKPSIKDSLTEILIGIALIVVPLVYPFGLKIGTLRILGPVPTTVIMIVAGLLLFYSAYNKYRKARLLSAGNSMITVDGDTVTYPVLKKGKAAQESFKISDVTQTAYDNDDCELLIVTRDDRRIVFELSLFESLEHLREFYSLIKK